MLRLMKTIVSFLFMFPLMVMGQQTTSKLFLQSGTYSIEPNIDEISISEFSENEIQSKKAYRIISLSETPDELQKKQLQNAGVLLLDYIPSRSFYAAIDPNRINAIKQLKNIVSISPIETKYKLTPELQSNFFEDHQISGNEVKLELTCFNEQRRIVEQEIQILGGNVLQVISENSIEIQISKNSLPSLYAIPECYFFRGISPEGKPENLPGRTNHRSNFLASDYSGGLHYDGTGVTIMMQDDGYIGPHIDYKGRIDQSG